MRNIFLVLALMACVGCSSPSQPAAVVPPSDWQTFKAGSAFTFKAPPDLKEEKVQGIDSLVGQFVSPGMKMSYDYGWYSNPLDDEGYERSATTIDGREAFIARKDNLIGVYFPEVGPENVKLMMLAELSGADPQTAETLFHTIDFTEK